jgi:hypothetical protein
MFEGGQGYSKEEVWRLRWKLDLRLIPILWFNVLLPAMDKVSHATAALYGLKTDLNLVGNQYAWIGSVFYVSHILSLGSVVLNRWTYLLILLYVCSLAIWSGVFHPRQCSKSSQLQRPCLSP